MTRSYDVFLHSAYVGRLVEDDAGRVSFRIVDSYRTMLGRPVLSQSFEDDLERIYRSRKPGLPAFFANMIPEGRLRELIQKYTGIATDDHIALLAAVAHDLPGAVDVYPGTEEEIGEQLSLNGNGGSNGIESEGEPGLRFSLAGMQLKFSVIRRGEKLTLPASGERGKWIIKLDSSRFPNVVENEFSMMKWAEAIGFEVPECRLQVAADLEGLPRSHVKQHAHVLAIKRYDRDGTRRIHQEDFLQVAGLRPDLKYDYLKYEQLAILISNIVGGDGYDEFIRRLSFVVASGNADAHLKNWSLIYPDRVNATMSPLYDQVSTVAWPELEYTLAIKLAGVKDFAKVDEEAFRRLAKRAGGDQDRTLELVRSTVMKSADVWTDVGSELPIPADHVNALRKHWDTVPLLKGVKNPF